jgi:ribose transport system permease protein
MESRSTSKFRKFITSKEATLVIMLIVIVVAFGILSSGKYYRPSNIKNILNSAVLVALFTIGEGMLIISGGLDLSAGYCGTAAGIWISYLMTNAGIPWVPALIIAVLCGAIVGLINGVLVNVFNFQPFIATLAMMSVCQGIGYIICNAVPISIKNDTFAFIGGGKIPGLGIPFAIVIAIVLVIIYGLILGKTQFGHGLYLIGSNPTAARLAGLNPKKVGYIMYINCSALSALAGCILASRLKMGNVQGTSGQEMTAITAAVLGGISFGGGTGGMVGCVFGIVIISAFNNGLTVMNVSSYWQTVASGLLLVIALLLDYATMKSRRKNV